MKSTFNRKMGNTPYVDELDEEEDDEIRFYRYKSLHIRTHADTRNLADDVLKYLKELDSEKSKPYLERYYAITAQYKAFKITKEAAFFMLVELQYEAINKFYVPKLEEN